MPILSVTEELNLFLAIRTEGGLLREESRVNSKRYITDHNMWHVHVSSNGDSCSQFLIGWPQWSRVSLIRKSEFVFINWVHFCSFFSAFFKYQSGNHVLPLPLLKLWWFHLNWEICYTCMYEFILNLSDVYDNVLSSFLEL